MSNEELIALLNDLGEEKITEIEDVNASNPTFVKVIAIAGVKRLEYTLYDNGDLTVEYLGVKLLSLN